MSPLWVFLLPPHCCRLGAGSIKAMQDEGVIYVAGHPLLNRRCTRLPGCIRLWNHLYTYIISVEWGPVELCSLTRALVPTSNKLSNADNYGIQYVRQTSISLNELHDSLSALDGETPMQHCFFKINCEQKAIWDEGVIYVAGHPLLNRRCT